MTELGSRLEPTEHRYFGLPMNTPNPRIAKAAVAIIVVAVSLFITTAVVSCVAANSGPDQSWKAVSKGH